MKKTIALAVALVMAGSVQAAELNGPWVEARAGWDSYGAEGQSQSGLLYGAAAGYDIALGAKGFAGVQVGISDSTTQDCELGFCIKSGRDLEVLARAGASVADRTAIYALAGYADSEVRAEVEGFNISATQGGLRLGAGLEQGIGSKTYMKLEYRYTDFGNINFDGDTFDAGNRHQVTASFGIRF